MSLSLTPEDIAQLEDVVARGVATGLSSVGLGYDDEEGKVAIRADMAWVRSGRLASEERISSIRKSTVSGLMLVLAAGVLYLAVHLSDFAHFLENLAGASSHPTIHQP